MDFLSVWTLSHIQDKKNPAAARKKWNWDSTLICAVYDTETPVDLLRAVALVANEQQEAAKTQTLIDQLGYIQSVSDSMSAVTSCRVTADVLHTHLNRGLKAEHFSLDHCKKYKAYLQKIGRGGLEQLQQLQRIPVKPLYAFMADELPPASV